MRRSVEHRAPGCRTSARCCPAPSRPSRAPSPGRRRSAGGGTPCRAPASSPRGWSPRRCRRDSPQSLSPRAPASRPPPRAHVRASSGVVNGCSRPRPNPGYGRMRGAAISLRSLRAASGHHEVEPVDEAAGLPHRRDPVREPQVVDVLGARGDGRPTDVTVGIHESRQHGVAGEVDLAAAWPRFGTVGSTAAAGLSDARPGGWRRSCRARSRCRQGRGGRPGAVDDRRVPEDEAGVRPVTDVARRRLQMVVGPEHGAPNATTLRSTHEFVDEGQ